MRALLVVLGASFAMAGCIGAKKEESICADIIRSMVVDPSGLTINSVEFSEGNLRESSLQRYFDNKYPDGLTANAKELLDIRKKELGETVDLFVQVDYTASAGIGKVRDRALCRYFQWKDGEKELVSFTIRNKDYEQKSFLDIFLLHGRPDGLSVLYKVK